MKQTRRRHSAAFKTEVALAAIKERETLAQLSERYGVNQTTISTWETEFLKHSADIRMAKDWQHIYRAILENLKAGLGLFTPC